MNTKFDNNNAGGEDCESESEAVDAQLWCGVRGDGSSVEWDDAGGGGISVAKKFAAGTGMKIRFKKQQ
jgi:hypothetical protein